MSISAKHLHRQVIAPALMALGLWSPEAENLVLGTACQESACGTYLAQNGGPALGIFQMEPATHADIWENYLAHDSRLSNFLLKSSGIAGFGVPPPPQIMTWNLRYAAAMCRIHYRRVKAALPAASDIQGQAEYWKAHYNTPLGRGTVQEYLQNWHRYSAS
jgi:hypothetical protein